MQDILTGIHISKYQIKMDKLCTIFEEKLQKY